MMHRILFALGICGLGAAAAPAPAFSQSHEAVQYKVLATSKTSTMQAEMQEASRDGYRYAGVMGGETSFGGSEVVVVMVKDGAPERYDYRLLATSKTSTMQQEMQGAGNDGYEYRGQTVFSSAFGGDEVVVILERERTSPSKGRFEYRLLATKKTATLQKELSEAGAQGFTFVGMTVAQTAIGGSGVFRPFQAEIPAASPLAPRPAGSLRSSSRMAASSAAGLRCMYRWVVPRSR